MKYRQTLFMTGCCLFVMACSSSDAIQFAAVQGTVTHMGAPLADAQLTFVPEHGPVAFAMTDLSGKYSVSGKRGVAVGKVRVAVKIAGQEDAGSTTLASEFSKRPATPEEAQTYIKKAGEAQRQFNEKIDDKKSKAAMIPKRYASVDTSNLSYTVNAGGTNTIDIPMKE